MPDPRLTKLAKILVHYSLEIQPGQQFAIETHPWAEELTLAVYEEAIQAGAHAVILTSTPGAREIFFKHASDAQLDHISPIARLVNESFDASLDIWTEHNTRSLSGIDPRRMARASRARAPMLKATLERMARKELRWCGTSFPTHASAQEADMSLADYREFVFAAGLLNEEDPVAFWKKAGQEQQKLADWLKGRQQVVLNGSNVDLKLSIQERIFIPCDGKENFPDGEIFTGPVEDSVNGWIRFTYPAIEGGREVEGVELVENCFEVVDPSSCANHRLRR